MHTLSLTPENVLMFWKWVVKGGGLEKGSIRNEWVYTKLFNSWATGNIMKSKTELLGTNLK